MSIIVRKDGRLYIVRRLVGTLYRTLVKVTTDEVNQWKLECMNIPRTTLR